MQNSLLIHMLRSFNRSEIKELDKAIRSPFFNSQPMVTRFYIVLRKYYPDFKNKNLDKEKIYLKLYPGRKFNSQRIRSLSNAVKKIADDYLLFSAVKKSPLKGKFIKVENFLRRGLFRETERELKTADEILEAAPGIDEEFLKDKLYFETLNTQLYLSTERQQLSYTSVQNGFSFFFYYFFIRLAYFIHDTIVNNIVFNNPANSNLIENITRSIDYKGLHSYMMTRKDTTKYHKILDLYLLAIINNLDKKDLTYYEPLMSAVPEVIKEFSQEEKYNVYQMIEAVCWHKMAAANAEQYRHELFRINKMRLEDKVFSPDGKYMRLLLYRQILLTSIQLREFKWAEKFAGEYSTKLQPEHIKNMQSFSHAQILFEKGDFEKSLVNLNNVDFDIFTLKLDTRNLLLKIYYELNYFEEAFSLVDSYRHFLAENKAVSGYYREITLEFLNYYMWLCKIKMSKETNELIKFKDSLKNKTVYFYKWINEKISELEK